MSAMSSLIWIVSGYAAMSVVTLIVYGIDKHRALHGRWRVPERRLHLLEVLGGWPGAIVGQALFRHKRRKFAYMLVFAGVVLLHALLWIAIYQAGWLR